MSQQNIVDGPRVKAKGRDIFLLQFAPSLKEAAVDQHALARALDPMTGTGDAAIGAVKGQPRHEFSVAGRCKGKEQRRPVDLLPTQTTAPDLAPPFPWVAAHTL